MSESFDLDVLERIANASTPGPWSLRYDGGTLTLVISENPTGVIADCATSAMAEFRRDVEQDNAAFIATFDPPMVLALLREIRRLWAITSGLRSYERGVQMANLTNALDRVLTWVEEHGSVEWPDYDALVSEARSALLEDAK